MKDVLSLYEQDYSRDFLLVCIDEKPIQLLADTRPESRLSPENPKKADYEYNRMGTANVFCAVEPKVLTTIRLPSEE